MASPRVLLEWCRVTCATYPDVEITNMSTSFTDGLAFCAIIHKHRPDLIDFRSLSKDNAYENNKLAFEIAETKLGIPAFLHPKDMISTKAPDRLSVISYLAQYYCFFNGKSSGPAKLWSLHGTSSHSLSKSKTYHHPKSMKSLTDSKTSREENVSDARPQTVCSLCLKPVHLIQRHLIDGKVYHRSCFRCKVCHATLLPQSYTQGSDAGSLICAYHATNSKGTHVDVSRQTGSQSKLQTVCYSLGGQPITSVPNYTKKTESQDTLSCKTAETGGTERIDGRTRPVPAPRRISVGPVPAARIRSSQTVNSSPAAGGLSSPSKCAASPPQGTSPVSARSKMKSSHPWMALVHPGPWTQLPPAPPPLPTFRSKSASNLDGSSKRPKVPAPNPFEDVQEDDSQSEVAKSESEDQNKPFLGATQSECSTLASQEAEEKNALPQKSPDLRGRVDVAEPDPVKELTADTNIERPCGERGGDGGQIAPSDVTEAAGPRPIPASRQSRILPRSLSVPAIASDPRSAPVGEAQTDEAATSWRSKPSCENDPKAQRPTLSKSNTVQDLSPCRGPAPGHGFPLIKRKVQTDQCTSPEELQVQMREVDQHLETLEGKGVELERNLRGCKNDKQEEQMLMEWFCLIHERHVLMCHDTELVHLTKQKKLEDRQTDVEYDLRCLFNKPDKNWSQEDRDKEKKLMDELVTIIEQRNHIISCLDQDRQRERENNVLWEDVMNKDFQKEGLKELRKPKKDFKPTKVLKILNHKEESTKNSVDKKS
ncbi:MICAL-like protein 1 isoform X2 [Astatotilapia calliptera]|uniref:MICAL-like protein 1 isoform X2 n=1 Tax=Astatotilapia calliptera TaxID=8154 RepID=UPI000E429B41|nr:MICAL-like protein 1 isoform X2 [Astatotilapia calliptera]